MLGKREEDVVRLLPPTREPWSYIVGGPEHYSGYAGFFKTAQEVEEFAQGVRVAEKQAA